MNCLTIIVFVVALIWTLIVPIGQIATNFLLSSMFAIPKGLFVALPLVQSVLLILPFLPFAIFLKNHKLKNTFQAWIAAALFGVVFSPVQLVPEASMQVRAVISIVLGFLCILIILLMGWLNNSRSYFEHLWSFKQSPGNHRMLLIFLAIYLYPWLSWGALGSLIDTLIMLLNAIIFGTLATLLLDLFLFLPTEKDGFEKIGALLFTGMSASVTLFIFSSHLSFPFGGMQGIFMLSLPWIAWVSLFLSSLHSTSAKNPLLTYWLILCMGFIAPMVFIDPDELALVINTALGEIGTWAIYAALASASVAILFSFVILIRLLLIKKQNIIGQPNHSLPIFNAAVVLLAWVAGVILYFSSGQPGWYGEQLFVILKDQAAVVQPSGIQDISESRKYVYQTLVQHANKTQSELRIIFDRLGIRHQPYYLVNAIQVDGGPILRWWLMTRPEVDRVLDSPHLRPLPAEKPMQPGSEQAPSSPEWNIIQIHANDVWQDFHVTGKGVVIGQSDSGVQWDHQELSDSYRGSQGNHSYNWLDPWYQSTNPFDNSGHGTHTLGTILGNHTGIAPDASWFACANLVRNLGNPAFYLDCMQFMLAPYPVGDDPFSDGDAARGADIMNNSWGCPELEGCDTDVFLSAVNNLRTAGIFVVVSAGNNGPGCGTLKHPPANYAQVFSVGAMDQDGNLAFFSSIGPAIANNEQIMKPDLIAPGVDILSSTPGNSYAKYSGTSMASPHVVGVVALMWSANPKLVGDIEKTTQILIESSRAYQGMLPDCPGANGIPSSAVGYGIVDAYRAVELALQTK